MSGILVGVGLMVAGPILFLVGRGAANRASVRASGGSVAVGGDNNGSITNLNQNSYETKSSGHLVTWLSILVELTGIAVVIWHTMHLAAK